jgi:sugar O-acyltransferase (sialic acid O-acetyltransferase NeuD family)
VSGPASAPARRPLVILGTSLFGPEALDLVEDTGAFEVTAFVENWDRAKAGTTLAGVPVVWIDDALPLARTHLALCALGTTRRVAFIRQAEAAGFRFATVVHPGARVSRRSVLGEGTLVSAGVVVGADTRIGRHVILNRGCLVGHNTVVGDVVTLSPGANVAGGVTIGDGAYVAMGALVVDRVAVGAGALVAAGAVVVRDVPPRTEVRGVPARVVREGVDGR